MRAGRWTTAACLWLASFAAAAAPAATTTPLRVPESAAPTFSTYTSRDGLGDEIWSTIGFDRDGFVWAGSASTLARFDGYRWTQHPLTDGRSLVRDLLRDEDGVLWAIFEREGLARYDGRDWQFVGLRRFHQRFSTIVDGSRREHWVAHDGGLSRLDDGHWIDDPGNGGPGTARAIGIARTRTLHGRPREWLATATEGLWYRDLGSSPPPPWQPMPLPETERMQMTDLMVSHEGGQEELWALSYGGGIARLRDDGVRLWRADDGTLPSGAIYSAVQTRDSNGVRSIWIASRAGLVRLREEVIDVFDRRHGLPSDAVRGIKLQQAVDGTPLLWLATEGGLARATLSATPWQIVSRLGASENGVFGVLLEPDDHGGERLWVGSSTQGLAMLERGAWRRYTFEDGALPARGVRGLWRVPDATGSPRRLLSLVGAPLLEVDAMLRVQPLPTPWPVHPDEAVSQVIARRGADRPEWWVATLRSGIWRLRDGRWQRTPVDGEAEPWRVFGIVEQLDRDGRSWLWAAAQQGLARYDGERWQPLPAGTGGVPDDGFRAVEAFDDGGRDTLWASSMRHGVVRLDIDRPQAPAAITDAALPPAPDPTVYSVLRDSHGRTYVCTNNGVQQLTPLPGGGWSERVFRRRDGLVHDECNTNAQFVDAHDRYWVGTLAGLSVFDPYVEAAATTPVAKPLHVTAVRVDGSAGAAPHDGSIVLPPGVRELRFEYTLLSGVREDENRYRTQLLGYDPAPSGWSAERARSFTALAPGDYRFRIEARDFGGTPAVAREFALHVAPHWWQQPWLQVLIALAGGVLLAAMVLGWSRNLRARQRQLQRDVADRTAELSAANARLTELSYVDPLTGVANRRRLMEALAAAVERAQARHLALGLIVVDVDHFKDYNDRHGHLAGDTALRAIAHALQSATREQDLVARFGGEEFACLMVDADLATATRVAERMRALVEALPPRSLGNDQHTITLSAGVVSRVPTAGMVAETLIDAADAALYAAKAGGRNRVISVNGTPPTPHA